MILIVIRFERLYASDIVITETYSFLFFPKLAVSLFLKTYTYVLATNRYIAILCLLRVFYVLFSMKSLVQGE